MRPTRIILLGMLLALVVSACKSTPEGRIMGSEEEDYVGSKTAGAATYDRLIEEAVTKLLDRRSASNQGDSIRVAYMGVENASAEDLGDFREQIYELIDTSIETSERYRSISKRFVDAALRESGLRREDLFLPKHRRTFTQTLEASGNPVEYILFSKLTSGTTAGDGVKQRNYMLTLELVDVVTGDFDKESARIRKAYQD
jgi:hypothetical protein